MIDAAEVTKTFRSCLFDNREAAKPGFLFLVEGPLGLFSLQQDRLEATRETVRGWLEQLAPEFAHGWSFLRLPFVASGEQWGEHKHAQELIVLAQALGFARCVTPRQMWHLLPGGMPHYQITLP